VTAAVRARRRAASAELALAFLAGAASFALVSIVVVAIEADVPVLLVAVALVGAVAFVATRAGVAYAVPVAMASVLAYDWYYIPPTHDHDFPDSANLAALLVYLVLAVLIGQISSHAGRRAAASDAARGELAKEQAALRRMATLVGQGVPSQEVFAAVARELGQVLDVDVTHIGRYEPDDMVVSVASWSAAGDHLPAGTTAELEGRNVTAIVWRTGRPARMDTYDDAAGPIAASLRAMGVRSSVGAPIVVDGRLWGVAIASSKSSQPLPGDTESKIAGFTELVATAISNAEARGGLSRLAREQAALRHVATLVAQDIPSSELFRAVTREVGTLLGADFSGMARLENGGVIGLAAWAAAGEHPPLPERWEMQEGDPATTMAATRQPARWDDWTRVPGPLATFVREELGVRSTVACPIDVAGRLWGALVVHSKQLEPLPADTESRLAQFADLVATAVANSEARAEVSRLADEQTGLRRVATLVAEGAPRSAVLDAVAAEMEALLDADQVALNRFEPSDEILVLAHRGLDVARTPVGSRMSMEGESVTALVRRTGRPARLEGYGSARGALAELARDTGLHSSVSAPITVEGRLWGLITASWKSPESPPADTEQRMEKFAGLLDTAIANAEARAEIERLVEEQAALQRVATTVARGGSPEEVFVQVAEEVGRLLEADAATIQRYQPDGYATVVGNWGNLGDAFQIGTRMQLEGDTVNALIYRTAQPARVDSIEHVSGSAAERARDVGIRSGAGSPIVVDGRLWGAIVVAISRDEPVPPEAEWRIAQFTDLVAMAISNIQARSDLAASRARVVATADEERRRVVRDLHDGGQQRLVHAIVTLKLAQRALRAADEDASRLVDEALDLAEQGNRELRELAHGILPSALTHGGLRAGVDSVVTRLDLPVHMDVPDVRLQPEIEASAYFVVTEALTNVVKHSNAAHAEVTVMVEDGIVRVEVRDDGIGGADMNGHGLVGMADRVTALGGRLEIDSPAGAGTAITATLPQQPL
jgi:signal transduction histidine kinase